MGYFSELDLSRYEKECGMPSKTQQMMDRLCYLNERLTDLEDACPREMMSPGFDRCFYSECISGECDDIFTIQGVLQSIRRTEAMLRIAEEEERREMEEQQRRLEWRAAVLETGATPDCQLVLHDVFFPAAA